MEFDQQTNARLWRQGQEKAVITHHLIEKDTIDNQVMKVLKNKDSTQSALINAVKVNLQMGGKSNE